MAKKIYEGQFRGRITKWQVLENTEKRSNSLELSIVLMDEIVNGNNLPLIDHSDPIKWFGGLSTKPGASGKTPISFTKKTLVGLGIDPAKLEIDPESALGDLDNMEVKVTCSDGGKNGYTDIRYLDSMNSAWDDAAGGSRKFGPSKMKVLENFEKAAALTGFGEK